MYTVCVNVCSLYIHVDFVIFSILKLQIFGVMSRAWRPNVMPRTRRHLALTRCHKARDGPTQQVHQVDHGQVKGSNKWCHKFLWRVTSPKMDFWAGLDHSASAESSRASRGTTDVQAWMSEKMLEGLRACVRLRCVEMRAGSYIFIAFLERLWSLYDFINIT